MSNFGEQWPKLSLEQQQKLLDLLTRKVEVTQRSPHWVQLTIHWIGPVSMRPDPCLIWRQIPPKVKGTAFEAWELAIVKERYPTCNIFADILPLPLHRTWNFIRKAAGTCLHLTKSAPSLKRPANDFPEGACWNDVLALPDHQQAIDMIWEASRACLSLKKRLYPFWLLPADLDEVSLLGNALYEPQINSSIVAMPWSTKNGKKRLDVIIKERLALFANI